jgi:acyl-CoA thioesterase-2
MIRVPDDAGSRLKGAVQKKLMDQKMRRWKT